MKKISTKNRLKGLGKYIALFCTLLTVELCHAQAPANDECAGATSVPVNAGVTCTQTMAGTTVSATPSANVMTCVPTGLLSDVWFTFTATGVTQSISVSGLPPDGGAGIVVYSGTCSILAEVFCGTIPSAVVGSLTAGNTYYLRILTDLQGTFDVCITTPPPPPANDECAGAISVPVNPNLTCIQTVASSTIGASISTNAFCGLPGGFYPDVWFTFTATDTAHNIATPEITSETGIMTVYSGTCSNLSEIYCGDPNHSVGSLTIGGTYYVRIMSDPQSDFNICITTSSVVLPITTMYSQLDRMHGDVMDVLQRIEDMRRIVASEAKGIADVVYGVFGTAADAGLPGAQAAYDKLKVRYKDSGAGAPKKEKV
jgi:hypothetical protein